MADAPYSDTVLAHLRAPVRAGGFEPARQDVARGEAEDPERGHLVQVELVIGPDQVVADGRFRAFGCPATIASASYLLSRVVGSPREEARRLSPEEVAAALELPSEREGAAELAVCALRQALGDP